MNFEPSEDQASVLAALDQVLADFRAPPVEPVASAYSQDLADLLAESGFLDIAREDGFGPLDAALVVERVSRSPWAVETAATALVAPAAVLPAGGGPIALLEGKAGGPARFLPVARKLVFLAGDHAEILSVRPEQVAPVESLMAYPYGRLQSPEDRVVEAVVDAVPIRRRWRVGLAAEAAGAMAAALGVVLEHVKTRHAFGRPLGAFQAIQHRLAMAAETVESVRWLARRAAWSDTEADAALAAGFAQSRIAAFTYDLHQFSGAMGLTLEFPLHLWTYRLRALAGELGGASIQARAAAKAVWGDAA